MSLGVIFVIATLSACEAVPTWEPVEWKQFSAFERQDEVQRISNASILPADRARLDGNLHLVRPAPDDEYTKDDCLLGGLRSLKGAELSFVGNDAIALNDKEK